MIGSMSEALKAAEEYLSARRSTSVDELVDFLRIPSISPLPEHEDDVGRAAGWAAERLRSAGLEHVELLPTAGHPVVYGDWLHASGRRTVLIYGHFDVQPVDPLSCGLRLLSRRRFAMAASTLAAPVT
jgi:acetylornithine deacetylase/succinyl-diaminopimelate desuccinylase-like protein